MSIQTDQSAPEGGPQVEAAWPTAAAPAKCLRCATDLTHLPESARYCPRCGLDSQAPPAALLSREAAVRLSGADLLGEWRHLCQLTQPIPIDPAPQTLPPTEAHSLILQGYGNALYKLGRRYESCNGAARNLREASRCYLKAARLGNFWALALLAARCADAGAAEEREPAGAPPEPAS